MSPSAAVWKRTSTACASPFPPARIAASFASQASPSGARRNSRKYCRSWSLCWRHFLPRILYLARSVALKVGAYVAIAASRWSRGTAPCVREAYTPQPLFEYYDLREERGVGRRRLGRRADPLALLAAERLEAVARVLPCSVLQYPLSLTRRLLRFLLGFDPAALGLKMAAPAAGLGDGPSAPLCRMSALATALLLGGSFCRPCAGLG